MYLASRISDDANGIDSRSADHGAFIITNLRAMRNAARAWEAHIRRILCAIRYTKHMLPSADAQIRMLPNTRTHTQTPYETRFAVHTYTVYKHNHTHTHATTCIQTCMDARMHAGTPAHPYANTRVHNHTHIQSYTRPRVRDSVQESVFSKNS